MDATAAVTDVFVGIDVAKDRLDVHLRPAGESFAVTRDAAGLEALAARLRPWSPHAVAVEATGGFETVVVATLAAAALPVVVVNPAQVRAFARALGKRAKTDPIDAAVIAHFVDATRPAIRPLPDADTQALADLVARRRQIIQMIVAERQRERRTTQRASRKSIARLLKALEHELASLDRDLDDSVRGSPVWRDKEDLLSSVPGVGKVIARTLLAAGLPVDPAALRLPGFVAVPARDRIVPPQSALPLAALIPGAVLHQPGAGHIGMVAGASAETALWRPLRDWIAGLPD